MLAVVTTPYHLDQFCLGRFTDVSDLLLESFHRVSHGLLLPLGDECIGEVLKQAEWEERGKSTIILKHH